MLDSSIAASNFVLHLGRRLRAYMGMYDIVDNIMHAFIFIVGFAAHMHECQG